MEKKHTDIDTPVIEKANEQLLKVPYSNVNRELICVNVPKFNTETNQRQTCTHVFIPNADGTSEYNNDEKNLGIIVGTEALNTIGITQPFNKFYTYLGEKMLKVSNENLPITTREYVERLGITPTKEHLKYYRNQIDQFLILLSTLLLRYKDKEGQTVTTHVITRFTEGRGIFHLELDKKYLEDVNNGVIILFPLQYWRINTRTNPNLLPAVWCIWEQYANAQAYRNRALKGQEHIVRRTVPSLLKVLPSIPTVEDMKRNNDYRFRQRIIEPFARTWDTLEEQKLLREWGYCHPGGIALTNKELEEMDIYSFLECSVYFTIAEDYRITADMLPELIRKPDTKKKDK